MPCGATTRVATVYAHWLGQQCFGRAALWKTLVGV
jgi:hypothetical protein